MKPLRIWTNFQYLLPDAAELRQRLPKSHQLTICEKSGPDPRLADADIAFGSPDPPQVIGLGNLKWIQLTAAGYTPYDRDDLRAALKARGGALTNCSSVFDEPCAQHALALILSSVRRIPQSLDDQRSHRAWPSSQLRSQSRLLRDQTILIVGFGAIGRRLAELLAPFHAKVIALRRNPRGDESVECADIGKLNEWLPRADHVMNILPASSSTSQLFDADRFRKMKKTAVFYNIGRGTTVDQTALRVALETGHIAEAYVDVMMPEPLPAHDPLWTTPNCFITPHTAGGHLEENDRIVSLFLENLKRFESGRTLQDRVI